MIHLCGMFENFDTVFLKKRAGFRSGLPKKQKFKKQRFYYHRRNGIL
jgi:hypothetical protein